MAPGNYITGPSGSALGREGVRLRERGAGWPRPLSYLGVTAHAWLVSRRSRVSRWGSFRAAQRLLNRLRFFFCLSPFLQCSKGGVVSISGVWGWQKSCSRTERGTRLLLCETRPRVSRLGSARRGLRQSRCGEELTPKPGPQETASPIRNRTGPKFAPEVLASTPGAVGGRSSAGRGV